MRGSLVLVLASCAAEVGWAGCVVGSREDCNDHGTCKSDPFFDRKPFFNKCSCDFCWVGAGSCDTNLCLFIGTPIAIGLCVACALCCCATVAQAAPVLAVGAGVGAAGAYMNRQGQARQPNYSQPASARQQAATPFMATVSNTAPPLQANAARQMMVQCPPNASAGETLQVTSPDGFDFQVTVPLGVAPGQQFAVAY